MSAGDDDDLAAAPVADVLRFFRKSARLSQAELAKAAGVSDGLVGNVERGTRNLGRDTAERMAEVLHLTSEERRVLMDARDRYAEPSTATAGAPPWEQLLEQMTALTEGFERLADLVEKRLRDS